LETRLSNLARLCKFDHHQATHGKGRLSGGPGHWEWTDLTSGGVPDPPAAPAPDPRRRRVRAKSPPEPTMSAGAAFIERLRQMREPPEQYGLALG
jgi:hypothetical protein